MLFFKSLANVLNCVVVLSCCNTFVSIQYDSSSLLVYIYKNIIILNK